MCAKAGACLLALALASLVLGSCQSVPAGREESFRNGEIPRRSGFVLDRFDLSSLSGLAPDSPLLADLAVQAASRHGIDLSEAGAGGGRDLLIRLRIEEHAYDYDIQRYQSVACVLKILRRSAGHDELLAQFLITDDSILAVASTAYLYGIIDRAFGRMAGSLGKAGN
jgi:hypothetical protein